MGERRRPPDTAFRGGVGDLDRDGIPELVTFPDITMGSSTASVFRRGPTGWREVFRGGCRA